MRRRRFFGCAAWLPAARRWKTRPASASRSARRALASRSRIRRMYPAKPNRRRFPRVHIPPEAQLRCWGDGFRGLVRVLGEGGMFVDTIHPHPEGAEMNVVIEGKYTIQTHCVTRNHEPGWGMGLEFIELPETER